MKLVVVGPQGSAKTQNINKLLAHYGIDTLVDDWNGEDPLPERCLVLTNNLKFTAPRNCAIITLENALAIIDRRP